MKLFDLVTFGIVFLFSAIFSTLYASTLGDAIGGIESRDLAIGGATMVIEYLFGKTKWGSIVGLVLSILGKGLKKGSLKAVIPLFAISMLVVGCSSEQKEQAKVVTAKGLGEGVAKVLTTHKISFCDNKQVLECENVELAQAYFVKKSCDVLKADCFPQAQAGVQTLQKGIIARFACNTAVKMVLPALFPSKHMPEDLKAAGCRSTCLDGLVETGGEWVCEKL